MRARWWAIAYAVLVLLLVLTVVTGIVHQLRDARRADRERQAAAAAEEAQRRAEEEAQRTRAQEQPVPPPEHVLVEWDIQQPPMPSGPLREEPPSDWKYMRVNAWARVTNHTPLIITVDSEKFGLQGPGLHDDTERSLTDYPLPDAHLLNPNSPGTGNPMELLLGDYTPFRVGDLAPGQSVEGGLVFEMPDYQRPPLRLEYDAYFLDAIGRKYKVVERDRATGVEVVH